MKSTSAPAAAARHAAPNAFDRTALLGEYAGLAQHPGEDDERLALAIRVIEALELDERAAARPVAHPQ